MNLGNTHNCLSTYLSISDKAHDYFEKYSLFLDTDKLEEKTSMLKKHIKDLQAVAKRMADVSNLYTRYAKSKKAVINKSKNINPYPNENDHAVVRLMNDHTRKIKGISVPCKTVKTSSDVPVGYMYYVEDIKQYMINIGGVNIRGGLCDISNYKNKNTSRCQYGTECTSWKKNKRCDYYHDPEDYIKMGLEVPDISRSFTPGSWIYTKNKNPKTYFMRHVGDGRSIQTDLKMLKSRHYMEEVSNREGQLIHDLIIYLMLHSNGFLERYQHW